MDVKNEKTTKISYFMNHHILKTICRGEVMRNYHVFNEILKLINNDKFFLKTRVQTLWAVEDLPQIKRTFCVNNSLHIY